jgi:hypothetical protein
LAAVAGERCGDGSARLRARKSRLPATAGGQGKNLMTDLEKLVAALNQASRAMRGASRRLADVKKPTAPDQTPAPATTDVRPPEEP